MEVLEAFDAWKSAVAQLSAELRSKRTFEFGFHGYLELKDEQASVHGEGGVPGKIQLCVSPNALPRLPPFDVPAPARAVSNERWNMMTVCRESLRNDKLDSATQFDLWQFLVDRYEEKIAYKVALALHLGVLRADPDCEYKQLRNEVAGLVEEACRAAAPNPV